MAVPPSGGRSPCPTASVVHSPTPSVVRIAQRRVGAVRKAVAACDSWCRVNRILLPVFFFSSRRRHTRSVSAFLLNRSSDLEMDAVGALRLSPLRRGLAIDSTVDIFTFYVPHRHVYGEQWIKFMKDGVNATPLPTVNTTGYIDHAAFLGTINPDTN